MLPLLQGFDLAQALTGYRTQYWFRFAVYSRRQSRMHQDNPESNSTSKNRAFHGQLSL